jgi:hypothetical protein
MKVQEIYKKYKKLGCTNKENDGYININWVYDIIHDLFQSEYVITWYEFLRIFDKWTQPFMEYSIWKESWYSEEEIYLEIDKLRNKLTKTDFKEDEIYFDIFTSNK